MPIQVSIPVVGPGKAGLAEVELVAVGEDAIAGVAATGITQSDDEKVFNADVGVGHATASLVGTARTAPAHAGHGVEATVVDYDARAEQRVLTVHPGVVHVRVGVLYGERDGAAVATQGVGAVDDQVAQGAAGVVKSVTGDAAAQGVRDRDGVVRLGVDGNRTPGLAVIPLVSQWVIEVAVRGGRQLRSFPGAGVSGGFDVDVEGSVHGVQVMTGAGATAGVGHRNGIELATDQVGDVLRRIPRTPDVGKGWAANRTGGEGTGLPTDVGIPGLDVDAAVVRRRSEAVIRSDGRDGGGADVIASYAAQANHDAVLTGSGEEVVIEREGRVYAEAVEGDGCRVAGDRQPVEEGSRGGVTHHVGDGSRQVALRGKGRG